MVDIANVTLAFCRDRRECPVGKNLQSGVRYVDGQTTRIHLMMNDMKISETPAAGMPR